MDSANVFWFDCKVKYQREGCEKAVKEEYLVEALTFTEAEARITQEITPFVAGEGLDVCAVKKCGSSEIFYSDNSDADKYYQCKTAFITVDEKSGAEKQTVVGMYVHAADFDDAVKTLKKGMEGTMSDWTLVSVSETAIMDAFTYGREAN